MWPELFRASHTIGPNFPLPLGLFSKNQQVKRCGGLPLADAVLCVGKIRKCWLLKKWNWKST